MNETEFIAKVMKQLPGLPEPQIMVRLNEHPVESAEDAARDVANEHGEAVAIVDITGKLLAYCEPTK